MFRPNARLKKAQRQQDNKVFEFPLEELTFCLDRIESITERIRGACLNKPTCVETTPQASTNETPRGLFRQRRRQGIESNKEDINIDQMKVQSNLPFLTSARFVDMTLEEEEDLIELLRRTAELAVMGEKAGSAAQNKAEKRRSRNDDYAEDNESRAEIEMHVALFENFFERNALGLMVKLVTGESFIRRAHTRDTSDASTELPLEELDGNESVASMNAINKDVEYVDNEVNTSQVLFLPPIQIALQAIQSVSILIQNVSRATSLYFLLSNNYVNDLINLPLDKYTMAERIKRGDTSNVSMAQQKIGSQEISELTTHYVTFLKSLALRMNAETLQFFLKYPNDSESFSSKSHLKTVSVEGESNANSEISTITKPVQVSSTEVEFPLYARSLEFCSFHQDRFIRVTVMNICLNTLRLATVNRSEEINFESNISSPDGSLCQTLPFRERLAIAQHVCEPSRVEALVSPIFTKLAQIWGNIEEQIREIDLLRVGINENAGGTRIRDPKMEKAKSEAKKNRLVESLKDSLADLQDELLLLEDVFKVGLTSLNEQTIEMMLATFVYPLLLQPLLLFMQRFKSPQSASSHVANMADVLSLGAQTGASEVAVDEQDSVKIHEAAPAKTALFTFSAVFRLLSNQPLMRLLLTVLLHPLAPDSSGETMIRAHPDVAGLDASGNLCIRVDPPILDDRTAIKMKKSPYSFGNITGTKSARGEIKYQAESEGTCVYVLSPALTEVLEGKAGDLSLIAKTRSNPYRRAVLKCLSAGPSMCGLRQIAVLLMDAVVTRFDSKFVSDISFGVGLKAIADDVPLDERNLDSQRAFSRNNRDMGQKMHSTSRHTVDGSIGINFMTEVVSSLCLSLINVSTNYKGLWKLVFDGVASHSLLYLAKENPLAMQFASKAIENRRRLASAFISDYPLIIDIALGTSGLDNEAFDDEDCRVGWHTHNMVFTAANGKQFSVVGELLKLKDAVGKTEPDEYSVSIAAASRLEELTLRVCNFGNLNSDIDTKDAMHQIAATSTMAFIQVDALSMFLKDLAATKGAAFQGSPDAFTISRSGNIVSTKLSSGTDVNRSIFSSISPRMGINLLHLDEELSEKEVPEVGSVVGLVGRTAIPCVCEVPASVEALHGTLSASVVSGGIKWLSLYLVFLGRFMILAEPERKGSGGNGRVVTSAFLTRIQCDRDTLIPAGNSSPAKRLLLSHFSIDPEAQAPILFVSNQQQNHTSFGPFNRLSYRKSSMDLWFEDENAAEHAYRVMKMKISRALAKRGSQLREKWAKDA